MDTLWLAVNRALAFFRADQPPSILIAENVFRVELVFERYTENARRVIFFARYEASQVGSPIIETEHLLLGLLREDKGLAQRFLGSPWAAEEVWKRIHQSKPANKKIPGDLPLSNECKRALNFSAEEADQLSNKHIGSEHLLLGLLREEKCLAAQILHEHGLLRTYSRRLNTGAAQVFGNGRICQRASPDARRCCRSARPDKINCKAHGGSCSKPRFRNSSCLLRRRTQRTR